MANKNKSPRPQMPGHTRSVMWRIHTGQLGQLFFAFLLCDLFIVWLLMPRQWLQGIHSFSGSEMGEYLLENFLQIFMESILPKMQPLLTVQLFYWIYYLLFGSSRLYYLLQPLTRLTERTQALSRENSDEELFLQLESAVSSIDPLAAEQTIHTGNSELQGLENAVNRLLERMRQLYRQQTRFVSDASHELRTPIAVIQGYVRMLDRWGKEDPKILEESIAAVQSEADHMQHLVEQLLFLARSDSGRNPLTPIRFSLSDMLRETAQEYEMIDPGHCWMLRLPADDVFVHGDEAMLKQTLRILCDNAVKYSPAETSITLSLQTENGKAAFSVQDEGMGISPGDQVHIFERFYRADPSRARDSGGTGLGLSIAQWIVDRHEGRISVLSREGIGTRMTVTLPTA